MRDLFEMDLKNYNPDGKVFNRPSARAIIVRDKKILLAYSQKYSYYKFPGGGIKECESHEEAIIREVEEETGYKVVSGSVTEYGRVLRKQKDTYDESAVFVQENFYYFCDIEEEQGQRCLDAYEKEEGFIPVWIEPVKASAHNRENMWRSYDQIMVKREAKVLDMVDVFLRKKYRGEHEINKISDLGPLDYQGMLDFVEEELGEKNTERMLGKIEINYSRFAHIKRVLGWAKRLYDEYEDKLSVNYEDLMIATIFHDVGRGKESEQVSHAAAGVPITRDYLVDHGFQEQRAEYISSLVGAHSDKWKMQDGNIDKNLLLLMEADLLDDMGALGIVMDCMITEGRNPAALFPDVYDHICRFTQRMQEPNPMVTEAGKKFWDEKTKLVNAFVEALKMDLWE